MTTCGDTLLVTNRTAAALFRDELLESSDRNEYCMNYLDCAVEADYVLVGMFVLLCTLSICGLMFVAITILYNSKL